MTDRNAATWRARLAASLLTLAAGLAACGGQETGASSEPAGTPAERTFLSAMVPHHESALEMARAAEGRLENPEIREIQAAIESAQTAEIDQMERIHQRLFGAALKPDESAHEELGLSAEEAGMGHTMGAQPIERAAEPVDRAFVDQMIPHHRGAVVMSEAVLPQAEDAELKRLATAIKEAQAAEIETMTQVRERELGGAGQEHGRARHPG
jgi:uncharacterized protein (DUF305 family)